MRSHIVVLKQTISLKTIKHLVFVIEAQCVYSQVPKDLTLTVYAYPLSASQNDAPVLQTPLFTAPQLIFKGGKLAIIES